MKVKMFYVIRVYKDMRGRSKDEQFTYSSGPYANYWQAQDTIDGMCLSDRSMHDVFWQEVTLKQV